MPKIREYPATETRRWRANPRNSRAFSKRPETAKSGDTGSLGCQDSNLEMLFWKTPFEMSRGFRLNSEHIATRDSSPSAAEIVRSTLEVR